MNPRTQNIIKSIITEITVSKTSDSRSPRKFLEGQDLYPVSIPFGKITRGSAEGVKGPYSELKYGLTNISAKNLEAVSNKLGIEWDEMIIYKADDWSHPSKWIPLFATIGKSKLNGQMFMYDIAGIGQSGYSKIYSGKSKLPATWFTDDNPKFSIKNFQY